MLVTIALSFLSVCAAAADGGWVFLLKATPAGMVVEKVLLPEGQTLVFQCTPESGYVDVVLPVGPGGSANLAQTGAGRLLIARCQDGQIQVTERAGEKEWQRPPRSARDLAEYDIRVCVTGADGRGWAFVISQYEEVTQDTIGPVVDLFAGRVPLGPGDYVICTDTYSASAGLPATGAAPADYERYLFVRGRLPGGREGDFVLDLGAGQTVVAKAFLPADVEIREAGMVQYSAGQKEMLKYEPGGATGKVPGVLGHATLSRLVFGGIAFDDASVAVLPELPDVFGRPVVGILGIDLLRRAEVLRLVYPGDGRPGRLELRKQPSDAPNGGTVLPFSLVNLHVMVRALVNSVPVSLILDTGAPEPFLDAQAAKAAGVETQQGSAQDVRGLDAGSAQASQGVIREISLGARRDTNVSTRISALPVFDQFRAHGQAVGLLGNEFLAAVGGVEIDFGRQALRLLQPAEPSAAAP